MSNLIKNLPFYVYVATCCAVLLYFIYAPSLTGASVEHIPHQAKLQSEIILAEPTIIAPAEVAVKVNPVDVEQVTATISEAETVPLTTEQISTLQSIARDLQEFEGFYNQQKQAILAQEQTVYLPIIDKANQAQTEASSSQESLAKAKQALDAIFQKITVETRALDAQIALGNRLCSPAGSPPQTHIACINLHDAMQNYEAEVSTLLAMQDVMKTRYEQALQAVNS